VVSGKKDLPLAFARHTVLMIGQWIRSRHSTWRFFFVTPNALVEIDYEGNRLVLGSGWVVG
jgi:hypothetical protein